MSLSNPVSKFSARCDQFLEGIESVAPTAH